MPGASHFLRVGLNEDESVLSLDGATTEPLDMTRDIDVAVIAVDDDRLRLQFVARNHPDNSWDGQCANEPVDGRGPLKPCDLVYLVGAATLASGELFLWGEQQVVKPASVK